MKNVTPSTPEAQAEAPKPTLATIEAKLVDAYLDTVAQSLRAAIKQVQAAMPIRAWGKEKDLQDLIKAELFQDRSLQAYEIKKAIHPESMKKIAEHVCGDFLRKVEEIGDFANEAASRGD